MKQKIKAGFFPFFAKLKKKKPRFLQNKTSSEDPWMDVLAMLFQLSSALQPGLIDKAELLAKMQTECLTERLCGA